MRLAWWSTSVWCALCFRPGPGEMVLLKTLSNVVEELKQARAQLEELGAPEPAQSIGDLLTLEVRIDQEDAVD